MINLWSGHGPMPTTMDEVLWRQKQTQYASWTRTHLDACEARLNLDRANAVLEQRTGVEVDNRPVSDAEYLSSAAHIHIVHLIYHPATDQVAQSDAEFSRASIAGRRAAGYADMQAAIRCAPWNRTARPAHRVLRSIGFSTAKSGPSTAQHDAPATRTLGASVPCDAAEVLCWTPAS